MVQYLKLLIARTIRTTETSQDAVRFVVLIATFLNVRREDLFCFGQIVIDLYHSEQQCIGITGKKSNKTFSNNE